MDATSLWTVKSPFCDWKMKDLLPSSRGSYAYGIAQEVLEACQFVDLYFSSSIPEDRTETQNATDVQETARFDVKPMLGFSELACQNWDLGESTPCDLTLGLGCFHYLDYSSKKYLLKVCIHGVKEDKCRFIYCPTRQKLLDCPDYKSATFFFFLPALNYAAYTALQHFWISILHFNPPLGGTLVQRAKTRQVMIFQYFSVHVFY